MRVSGAILWLAAAPLLWLSLYRPFAPTAGRAQALPQDLGGYTLVTTHELQPQHFELLGTDDATWREYRDRFDRRVFMVAVFHRDNWKSVHPPHICLEGSDMTLTTDDRLRIAIRAPAFDVGRIVARENHSGRDYVSLYAYGADELLTPSYWEFVRHHAPRAVLRRPIRGFLLRVETYVGAEGLDGAQQLCADFLDQLVPVAQAALREGE